MNRQAIIEAIKEIARVAFLAGVTALLGYLTQLLTNLDPSSVYYIVGTVVLRGIDRYIHEAPEIPISGISPI